MLKEAIVSKELSLRGMWDTNEKWSKKYDLLLEKYESLAKRSEHVKIANTNVVPIKPTSNSKVSNGVKEVYC
ncbi:MAG: hypothetical protein AAF960_00415 [Bacteroidota bacterium]